MEAPALDFFIIKFLKNEADIISTQKFFTGFEPGLTSSCIHSRDYCKEASRKPLAKNPTYFSEV